MKPAYPTPLPRGGYAKGLSAAAREARHRLRHRVRTRLRRKAWWWKALSKADGYQGRFTGQ